MQGPLQPTIADTLEESIVGVLESEQPASPELTSIASDGWLSIKSPGGRSRLIPPTSSGNASKASSEHAPAG